MRADTLLFCTTNCHLNLWFFAMVTDSRACWAEEGPCKETGAPQICTGKLQECERTTENIGGWILWVSCYTVYVVVDVTYGLNG